MRNAIAAAPLLLVFATSPAAAELNRCAEADTDVAWTANDFVNFSGDTGWFPSGSPGQLRLTAKVGGKTEVAGGYTAKTCWGPENMTGSLVPRAASGFFDVAYGAELALFGRIHVSVLGKSFDWEGQINILGQYFPDDLLIAGTKTFDPLLTTTTSASVSDTTDPVPVIQTDVISNFISLGGISGGLYVNVRGGMTTTYRAGKTLLAGTAVDSTADVVTITRPETGFHGSHPVGIAVDGVVRYAPRLTFAAGLDVRILGFQVVNWEIASKTVSLPAIERTLKLTGPAAMLMLPELDGVGAGARMDFSAAPTQVLPIKNIGQTVLQLEPTTVPPGVTATPIVLQPGEAGELRVTVDNGALAGTAKLVFNTNDPDRPTIAIDLAQSGGTDPGDTETPTEIGQDGGCSTGSGHGFGALVLFGLVALRRRRR